MINTTPIRQQDSLLSDSESEASTTVANEEAEAEAEAEAEEMAPLPQTEQQQRQQQQQQQQQTATPLPPCPDFCMGDHVYHWCWFLGIPAAFAQHGIVLDVVWDQHEWRLVVADFSPEGEQAASLTNEKNNHSNTKANEKGMEDNQQPENSENNRNTLQNSARRRKSSIRVYKTDPAKWHKVTYEAGFWQKQWSRGGTATSAASDPPAIVRARVAFLLNEPPHRLPPYDAVRSNSECVAVWCKTGTWATLQATSWLSAMAAGQVKSTATLVGAASAAQVTVPSAGLWGWLGYTTQVSLLSTQPWIVPALAGYGLVTIGGPALWLALAQRHWKKLTQDLNTAFWQAALERPDEFCEHVIEWSAMEDSAMVKTPATLLSALEPVLPASHVLDATTEETIIFESLPLSLDQNVGVDTKEKISDTEPAGQEPAEN